MWKCLIINNMDNPKNFPELLPSEQTAKGRLTCSVVNLSNPTRNPNLTPSPLAPIGAYCHLRTPIVTKCNLSKNPPRRSSLSLITLQPPNSDRRPPASVLRALRASVVDHRLALTPCSQTKADVANCRRSKIRPKTYTRNAGFQTGKSRAIPASSPTLNTQLVAADVSPQPIPSERGQPVRVEVRCNTRSDFTGSLQPVAPCCAVLQRVAPKNFAPPDLNTRPSRTCSELFDAKPRTAIPKA